jgi:hypothetical protein
MHVNSLLFASVVVTLPLTLITLYLLVTGHEWRTYRVSIDVTRPATTRDDDGTSDLTVTPTDAEPSTPYVRGPGGVRGWVRRRLYTYYRRR